MCKNDLHEKFQSAYQTGHGTETALVKIHNKILQFLNIKKGVLLVILKLSAAFDTVDHNTIC